MWKARKPRSAFFCVLQWTIHWCHVLEQCFHGSFFSSPHPEPAGSVKGGSLLRSFLLRFLKVLETTNKRAKMRFFRVRASPGRVV
jgi:hypothetical protein